MWKIIITLLFLLIPIFTHGITNTFTAKIFKSSIRQADLASLQRGAKYFMNYCSGCHSMQFIRYNRLAVDLKIIDKFNPATVRRLKDNLIFTQSKPSDRLRSNLPKKEALLWFGKPPPDLSLSIRARSIDWVYNYLLSFYPDNTRPFGVNNSLIRNTAMPDPLATLRADASYTYRKISGFNDRLSQKISSSVINSYSNKSRSETPALEEVLTDLVNFLAYAAEPTKINRQSLGKKACGFLLFFVYLVYFLKKQIWKNLK
jgi:ubiquinol-cytochrome c reductase cytochrome c1 subunit